MHQESSSNGRTIYVKTDPELDAMWYTDIREIRDIRQMLNAVTMKDVIRQTEKENAEKLARIRAERAARQEAFEREQAEREAARAAANGEEGKKPAKKPAQRKKPAEPKEAPKAEAEGEKK